MAERDRHGVNKGVGGMMKRIGGHWWHWYMHPHHDCVLDEHDDGDGFLAFAFHQTHCPAIHNTKKHAEKIDAL